MAGVVANALFVALYLRGGSLWLPIGFHFGWNLALSGLAGTTMSGTEQSFGLFRIQLTGAGLLTGGTFGIELSVIALVIWIALTIGLFRLPFHGEVTLLDPRPESARQD